MAIIRNAANRKLRGRVGDTTYYVSKERQIARQALNGSNYGESARRTEAQQRRRVRWSNLVNFYKLSKGWMPKAFESKKAGQSDYNRFMSINLATAKVALTKDEALQGGCVVEPFVISQGSLRSIEITKAVDGFLTNISVGDDGISAETTVADFTSILKFWNPWIEEGMQLSFVSYQQFTNQSGIPQSTCAFYEVTLNESNTNPIWNYLPSFCCSANEQRLGTNDSISEGCFAYILSDQRGGKVRVSSQSLYNNNRATIALYSTPMQTSKAIDSYGLDTEVVLSPITENAQEPLDQPLTIQSVYFSALDEELAPNDKAGMIKGILERKAFDIRFNNSVTSTPVRIIAKAHDASATYSASFAEMVISDNVIHMGNNTFLSIDDTSNNLEYIKVTFVDGIELTINFDKGYQD